MRCVYPTAEQNDKLAILAANRLGVDSFQPCQCIAFMDANKLAGVVVYSNYRHPSIEVSIFCDDPRWALNRDMIEEALMYPFRQLKVNRITALVQKNNKRSRKMVKRLGFVEEGKLRKASTKDDLFVYGLLPEEYRLKRHGKEKPADTAAAA